MDNKSVVLGIIALIFGLYLLSNTLKGLYEFEINYRTLRGFFLSIGGILAGIYLIANELAKIY